MGHYEAGDHEDATVSCGAMKLGQAEGERARKWRWGQSLGYGRERKSEWGQSVGMEEGRLPIQKKPARLQRTTTEQVAVTFQVFLFTVCPSSALNYNIHSKHIVRVFSVLLWQLPSFDSIRFHGPMSGLSHSTTETRVEISKANLKRFCARNVNVRVQEGGRVQLCVFDEG